MTQQQYIIQRKVGLVELGKALGNISEACRKIGSSRQHYYDIKRTIEEEGIEGLVEKTRRMPRYANRVPQEIEHKLGVMSSNFIADKARTRRQCLEETRKFQHVATDNTVSGTTGAFPNFSFS